MLKADEEAALLIGPDFYLNVLQKVDSLRFKDIEKRKKGGYRVRTSSHFPAIDARIRRVTALTTSGRIGPS